MSAIDPGVEDTITQEAGNIETGQSEHDRDRIEEEDFNQSSRWWFASTACPLLAGTFGPIASGFNICALVQYWRQSIPDLPRTYEGEGHPIPDPAWVLALNALSLVAAVVGNAALLLNMAHRIKFSVAQPITIAGFLLGGLILMVDLAALGGLPAYGLQDPALQPPKRHALSQAFYYGIFASFIYVIIGLLMSLTVYGAMRGHFKKDFHLTSSQRTLMLQTMAFITYLLLGAAVYSRVEGWAYLNAVYWADVTLLTIGLGDFSPSTTVGRGLLFPFAIGGILMVGLVVGSIRSLVLERGKEKLGARVMEKKRSGAVHNVDSNKKTIRISLFAHADYDPTGLSPAQQREEEFRIMRKVQRAAERERRWMSLSLSSSFALLLWFLGAYIFKLAQYKQGWTYFESLYFSYVALLTIGYGDFYPQSNSAKAFFVLWSLLAVPSLTILISNMGDTIIKWFTDLTNWVASLTVLPEEKGFRATFRKETTGLVQRIRNSMKLFTAPGILGDAPKAHEEKKMSHTEYENDMLDRLAERLGTHVDKDTSTKAQNSTEKLDSSEDDIRFYHYVLARECRNVQKDLDASPPKSYEWYDWEYYLKLMGDEDDPRDFPGQEQPDILVPETMKAPEGMMNGPADSAHESEGTHMQSWNRQPNGEVSAVDGNVDRRTSAYQNLDTKRKLHRRHQSKGLDSDSDYLLSWSWLSNSSPLMSEKSEAQWILDRLSAALERELNRQRKGYKRKPPITLADARRPSDKKSDEKDDAKREDRSNEQRHLARADQDEA